MLIYFSIFFIASLTENVFQSLISRYTFGMPQNGVMVSKANLVDHYIYIISSIFTEGPIQNLTLDNPTWVDMS